MSYFYLDTSVIAAYYIPEALSNTVEEFLKTEPHPAVSQLVEVELFSAISRRVRTRELSQQDARRIANLFQAHLESGLYDRLPLEPAHFDLACDWISRFTLPLRSLDALHLAIAESNHLCLVTADAALSRSAYELEIVVELLRV